MQSHNLTEIIYYIINDDLFLEPSVFVSKWIKPFSFEYKKLNPKTSACNKHVRVKFIIESATTLNTFHLIVTTYSTTTVTSLKIDQCCYNGEEAPVYSSKPESLHTTDVFYCNRHPTTEPRPILLWKLSTGTLRG